MQDLIKVAVCFMYCLIISPGALCTGGGGRGGVTAVHEGLGSLGHVDSSILKFDSSIHTSFSGLCSDLVAYFKHGASCNSINNCGMSLAY